jgi:DNA-directed RNA polymerase alpha subunit
MTNQTTTGTSLATLAADAQATGDWWKEGALEHRPELALPTRVLAILDNAGIRTVEQLKAAGPARLRELPNLGKQAFEQIVEMLRAFDQQQNGGSNGHDQGQAGLR